MREINKRYIIIGLLVFILQRYVLIDNWPLIVGNKEVVGRATDCTALCFRESKGEHAETDAGNILQGIGTGCQRGTGGTDVVYE